MNIFLGFLALVVIIFGAFAILVGIWWLAHHADESESNDIKEKEELRRDELRKYLHEELPRKIGESLRKNYQDEELQREKYKLNREKYIKDISKMLKDTLKDIDESDIKDPKINDIKGN